MSQVSIKKFDKIVSWLEHYGFIHVFGEYTPKTCHKNEYMFNQQYDLHLNNVLFSVYLTNHTSVSKDQNKYMQIKCQVTDEETSMYDIHTIDLQELEERYKRIFPAEYREHNINLILDE